MRHGVAWAGVAGILLTLAAGCNRVECTEFIDQYFNPVQFETAKDAITDSPVRQRLDEWFQDMDKPIGSDEDQAVALAGAAGLPVSMLTMQATTQPTSQPASRPAGGPPRVTSSDGRSYVPWQQRRGPAYPGDFWTSFGRDGKEILPTLGDDTVAMFKNPWSLAGFAAVAATGITLNNTKADPTVADHFHKHGHHLNSFWDTVGDAGGSPATGFAVMGAMYFTSLATEQVKTYEVSKTLLNTLIITDLADIALKVSAHTDSPNRDKLAWPSGHEASTFAFATVLAEAYGPWVGVPAYGFAAFVGYERLDARNHQFSDVISGALLGMAIAHGVSQNHHARIFGFEVVPMVMSGGEGIGVGLVKNQ